MIHKGKLAMAFLLPLYFLKGSIVRALLECGHVRGVMTRKYDTLYFCITCQEKKLPLNFEPPLKDKK